MVWPKPIDRNSRADQFLIGGRYPGSIAVEIRQQSTTLINDTDAPDRCLIAHRKLQLPLQAGTTDLGLIEGQTHGGQQWWWRWRWLDLLGSCSQGNQAD